MEIRSLVTEKETFIDNDVTYLRFAGFLDYFLLPNTIIIICSCVYVTVISMCSVAKTAVLWLPTRTSGGIEPQTFWWEAKAL